MSGVEIIGALLLASPDVLALVPAERIKGGMLPDGIELDALLVRTVSVVERHKLKRSGMIRTIERVSVTMRARSYVRQKAGIKAVVRACAGKTGDVAGATNVSILTAGTGPDVIGPGTSFEQAQDFRVSSDAPA